PHPADEPPPGDGRQEAAELRFGIHSPPVPAEPADHLHPNRLDHVGRIELRPDAVGQVATDDGAEGRRVGPETRGGGVGLAAVAPVEEVVRAIRRHAGTPTGPVRNRQPGRANAAAESAAWWRTSPPRPRRPRTTKAIARPVRPRPGARRRAIRSGRGT